MAEYQIVPMEPRIRSFTSKFLLPGSQPCSYDEKKRHQFNLKQLKETQSVVSLTRKISAMTQIIQKKSTLSFIMLEQNQFRALLNWVHHLCGLKQEISTEVMQE